MNRSRVGLLMWALTCALAVSACDKKTEEADAGLFCKEHGVPEKFCTLCHAELKSSLLLCTEHGNIPEEICTLCHPEAKEKYKIEVCPEHGLPKHFCIECEKAGKGEKSASGNLIDDGWIKKFGERSPDGKLAYCKELPLARLARTNLGEEIGLETAPVVEQEQSPELTAYAELAYDSKRRAAITPRFPGFLKEVRVDVGSKVAKGDVLAILESADVSAAKAEYISSKEALKLAESNHQRVEKLSVSSAIPAKERPAALAAANQARAAFRAAEQRLRSFRFGEHELASVLQNNDTKPLVPIISPLEGTVVSTDAIAGASVDPDAELFTVADTAALVLWINVFEAELDRVREGQEAFFWLGNGAPTDSAEIYPAKVTWIGSEVDDKTRMAKVRAELVNPEGKLRAHQIGRARIRLGDAYNALTIPKGAIQKFENVDIVFLPEDPGVYRPQRIKSRPLEGTNFAEVAWGLAAGQSVVVSGAFLLKTEIMKGSIGAGCCD